MKEKRCIVFLYLFIFNNYCIFRYISTFESINNYTLNNLISAIYLICALLLLMTVIYSIVKYKGKYRKVIQEHKKLLVFFLVGYILCGGLSYYCSQFKIDYMYEAIIVDKSVDKGYTLELQYNLGEKSCKKEIKCSAQIYNIVLVDTKLSGVCYIYNKNRGEAFLKDAFAVKEGISTSLE